MNQTFDIINNKFLPIDQRLILDISKTRKNNKTEGHSVYKILRFSNEWKYEEVLKKIQKLNASTYPELFIFIIEINDLKLLGTKSAQKNIRIKIKLLKNIFANFCEDRSAVLQISSKPENSTKLYYKEKCSDQFIDINLQQSQARIIKDFPTFVSCLLKGELPKSHEDLIEQISVAENFELIQKNVKILGFSEMFLIELIVKCAAKRPIQDLLAMLNVQTEDKDLILSIENQKFITETITKGEDVLSVLSVAVANSNNDVVVNLVKKFSHLINQLPFEHQVEITTTALTSNQYEILCDLIEFADFPLPKHFDKNKINNERLNKILKDREDFSEVILEQNLEKMSKFIENNSKLKIVYSIDNESALCLALDTKNFKSFCYLKSLGFLATEFDRYTKMIDNDDDLELLCESTKQQTKENVENSLADGQKSIKLLTLRSFIHNKKIDKQTEVEYRRKIKKWYEDIYDSKFGSELLDAVSQCDYLKIIFDFECGTVSEFCYT